MAETVKASAYNAGDLGSIPGMGRSPGEGNGNPLQYLYLENVMDSGAWQATVHTVAKSWAWLRTHSCTLCVRWRQFTCLDPTFTYLIPILHLSQHEHNFGKIYWNCVWRWCHYCSATDCIVNTLSLGIVLYFLMIICLVFHLWSYDRFVLKFLTDW